MPKWSRVVQAAPQRDEPGCISESVVRESVVSEGEDICVAQQAVTQTVWPPSGDRAVWPPAGARMRMGKCPFLAEGFICAPITLRAPRRIFGNRRTRCRRGVRRPTVYCSGLGASKLGANIQNQDVSDTGGDPCRKPRRRWDERLRGRTESLVFAGNDASSVEGASVIEASRKHLSSNPTDIDLEVNTTFVQKPVENVPVSVDADLCAMEPLETSEKLRRGVGSELCCARFAGTTKSVEPIEEPHSPNPSEKGLPDAAVLLSEPQSSLQDELVLCSEPGHYEHLADDSPESALIAEAQTALDCGKYDVACALARAALRSASNPGSQSKAAEIVADALVVDERGCEAKSVLDEVTLPCESSCAEPPSLQNLACLAAARLAAAKAKCEIAVGRHLEAQSLLESALVEIKSVQDIGVSSSVLRAACSAGRELGTARGTMQALRYAEDFLELARKSNISAPFLESEALLEVSRCHLARYELEDAFAFAGAAVEAARDSGGDKQESDALCVLSQVSLALAKAGQEDVSTAVHYAWDAVELCRCQRNRVGEISARCHWADALKRDGMNSMAIESLQEAMSLAQELNHRPLFAKALDLVTQLYPPDKAAGVMREKGLETECPLLRWEAVKRSVLALCAIGQNDEALADARKSLEDFQRDGKRRSEAFVMRTIAEIQEAMRNHDAASQEFTKSHRIFDEVGDVTNAVDVLKTERGYAESIDDLAGALRAADGVVSVYRRAGWREKVIEATTEACDLRARARSPRDAMSAVRGVLRLADHITQPDARSGAQAEAWLAIGEVQMNHDFDYGLALRSAAQARKLYKGTGNGHGESKAIKLECGIMLAQGASDESVIARSKHALEVCLQLGDAYGVAHALEALCDVHKSIIFDAVETGDVPNADTLEDALNLLLLCAMCHEERGNALGQVMALLELSNLYLVDDDAKAALQAATEAKDLAQSIDDISVEADALLSVAKAHMHDGNWEETKNFAEDALALYEDSQNTDGEEQSQCLLDKAKENIKKNNGGNKQKLQTKAEKKPNTKPDDGLWASIMEAMEKSRLASKRSLELRRNQLLKTQSPVDCGIVGDSQFQTVETDNVDLNGCDFAAESASDGSS